MSCLAVCLILLSTVPGILSDCPVVEAPQWGIIREKVLTDGTLQIIFSCETTHRLKGHKIMTCTADGWDHSVPRCVPRELRRYFRNDFYLGDQPVAPDRGKLQIAKDRLKALERIDELKKRGKTKEGKRRKKKRRKQTQEKFLSKLPAARRLNETVVSQLDISCFTKAPGKKHIKAPAIEHAYPAKYTRRKNVLPPYNRYIVAVYECADGYVFVDSTTDRLFCSNDTWLGRRPRCIRDSRPPIDKVKRCDHGTSECEHVCEDTPNGIKCSCFDGFRAKGPSCIDIDECAEGTAKCTDICRNEPGSYSCECHRGFQLENDGYSCQDINECLSNNGHGPCQGTCRNLEGNYECSCANIPGYKLAADNHTCEDIDECALNNGNCSHLCLNTHGSVFCLCPDGFYLTDDSKTCKDVNECEVTPKVCADNADCENTVGSYKCITRIHSHVVTKILREEDYDNENEDDDDDESEDDDDYGEEITEVPQSPKCADGFKRNRNFECVDINECIENDSRGCQHECINEPGGYHCTCYDGYELGEDGATCKDVNECDNSSRLCSHICRNTIGAYVCECPSGYVLTNDNATCSEIMNCANSPTISCSHDCEDTEDGPRCVCPAGYELSDDHATCSDIDECARGNSCSHSCVNRDGDFVCTCPDGLEILEDANKFNCTDINECDGYTHGCRHRCANLHGGYECACHSGYALDADGRSCVDVNECADGSHGCSHECDNEDGAYKCRCPTGYEIGVDEKTCGDVDECARGVHRCSHDCANLPGSYECVCPDGSSLDDSGRNCVLPDACDIANCNQICDVDRRGCACREGYVLLEDGTTCQDIDECLEDEHDCTHECVNTPGSYKCACPRNTRLLEDGLTCEDMTCPRGLRQDDDGQCQDVNECLEDDHECTHGCLNVYASYRCSCPIGWILEDDGLTCARHDPCSNSSCSHLCVSTETSYKCECPTGYILKEDSNTCRDKDECENATTNDCSHDCENLEGSYSCSCPTGYQLDSDNRTCVVVQEECTKSSENNNCTCPTGYFYSQEERICEDIDECQDNERKHNCTHDCINTDGSYYCECPSGWHMLQDSVTCELLDDLCAGDHNCSHTCEQNDGQIRCGCPEGYELLDDERTCHDVDECADGSHVCSHICANIDGAYNCECPSGYRLNDDRRICRDRDECSSGDSDCSHDCLNTNGSYSCICPEGYELLDDGRTCEDVNECIRDNGGCSHLCANTDGGVECACPDNYKLLKDDGKTCVEINACSIDNGGCSHFCRHENGRAFCSCPPGMALYTSETICSHVNEGCLRDNGNCSHLCYHEDGNVTCACPVGMILTENRKLCVREDRCTIDNGGCSHTCHNQDGNVTCTCPEGMSLSLEDDTNCVRENGCLVRNGGCTDICSVSTDGSIVCECPDGYRLSKRDNATCVDVDECAELLDNCAHRCANTVGGYDCDCNDGFSPNSQDPTLCDDVDECVTGYAGCSHICANLMGSFRCHCPTGYVLRQDNRTCLLTDDCKRDNGNCSHYCHPAMNTDGIPSVRCSCPIGFRLRRDLKTCEDINECEELENDVDSGCSHVCINTAGGYHCECPAGHVLMPNDGKNCVDVDECLTNRHNCTHDCVNLLGGYVCACYEGHHLDADMSTCLDVDECQVRNGDCSHVCNNTIGGHICTCPIGYELSPNERTCVDVDECESDNGDCDHTCVNTVGSFRCECLVGYESREGSCRPFDPCRNRNGGCEQICVAANGTAVCSCKEGFRKHEIDESGCRDVDECAGQHGCDHICVNNLGSYECRCREGFRMVNSTCVDIDECAEAAPCSERCVNTPGSYYCTCPSGFRLQMNECIDIDECERRHDGCDQECINTVGSFICACRAGFTLISRRQCQDVNECLSRNGGCTGECINTAGSYYCTCSEDLVLAPDERTCASPPTTSRCRAMEPPLHGEIRCPGQSSGASVYPQGAKCHVRCRGGFRLEGAHTRHCVSDGRWNGREPICLREVVTDTPYNPNMPRPFVSCPQDMDVELPVRQNTIRVTFPQPKSNMNWWRYIHASPSWAKQLQADLPVGTTIVTFTAWSPVSNYTSTCRIVIRVRDTENPKVTMCPTSFEVRLSPGERNRLIFWQEPTFTDNVQVEDIYKTKGPGHVMYPGVHNVRYVATDAAGNRAECHFSIHVREAEDGGDLESRFYRRKMLMCPGRPPQPVPSFSYGWQIPSGCYLRYTRIFSGAYQRHLEHRQAAPQLAPPIVQRTRNRPEMAGMHNADISALRNRDTIEGDMCTGPVTATYITKIKAREFSPDNQRSETCTDVTYKPLEVLTKTATSSSRRHDRASQSLVMHYPAPIIVDSTSSSSLLLDAACKINSTPTLQSSDSILRCPSRRGDRNEKKIEDREPRKRKRLSLDRSSTYANPGHPIIDISNLDYKAYRHKLIEDGLRKQYDDYQPPGDVVLNSLHLNATDSVIGVRSNDRYDQNLFDFIEDYYSVAKATGRKNVERLHPLDHFLTKGATRPSRTVEKETEMIPNENIARDYHEREDNGDYIPENVNNNLSKLPGADNNGNLCVHSPPQSASSRDNVAIPKSDLKPKLELPERKTIPTQSRKCADKAKPRRSATNDCPPFADLPSARTTTRDRPTSAGSVSTISRNLALSRGIVALSERRDVTRSPRPKTSAGLTRESRKKLEDYRAELPSSYKRQTAKEPGGGSHFISASSSEIASICSDSSKRREEEEDDQVSCHSRESSISPRNRASRPPWLSGNRENSFNRKYGNITKDPARTARPMSAGGSCLSQKLAISNQGCTYQGEPVRGVASISRNPASPKRRKRAASFIASREREIIEMPAFERREENPRALRHQRGGLKDAGSIAVKGDETKRTSKTLGSPEGKISANKIPGGNVPSFLSAVARTPRVYTTRSPRVASFVDAPAAASIAVSPTWTTKGSRLTSRSDDGTRNKKSDPVGVAGRCESSLVRDQRANSTKLNRDGRRRLRSAENSAKGTPLSPKIELSAEVLNPADDTDKSAIPNGSEKLTRDTSRIDPRRNAGGSWMASNTDNATTLAVKDTIRSNNVNGAVRSRVPRIIQNPRARPLNVNNPPTDKSATTTPTSRRPAWRNANSETKSGLNGAKLNGRSNGAVGKMRCDESRKASTVPIESLVNVTETKSREKDIAMHEEPIEELKLPRNDSKIGLAMNSALKRYIKMLKRGLLDHSDKDGVALASLSLSDAISILSEQKASLSPEEIQELQCALNKIERNPELLCKESFTNVENAV